MKQGIRTTGLLWLLGGLALCAWAIWGLTVQDHELAIVISWLIGFAYGALCLVGGFMATRLRPASRQLLIPASILSLAYALVYFLFGGLHDAASYLPGVLGLGVLSVATLIAFAVTKINGTNAT